MSQQYDNTNTGLLSKADERKTDKSPEYRGKLNVEGVEYWLSGWIREGKEGGKMAGRKFFSLSVQRVEEQAPQRRAPVKTDTGFDQMDSDIPF